MSRRTSLPVVVVALAAAILAVVGCESRPKATPPASVTKTAAVVEGPGAADVGNEAGAKLFQNWPTPVGALVISGEQIGYLEPCGCTAGQRGGLARRYDLVEKLKKQGWELALADLGSLVNDPNQMGGPEETRIRYSFALKALEMMGYDALAIGTPDLKLGVGEVLTRLLNHTGTKLKAVSASLVPDPSLGLENRFQAATRTAAGPVKIGITSVIEPEAYAKLVDPEKEAMLKFRTPEEALPDILADLERDTHIQVLMVQGSPEAARKLALAHPGFEVVVATSPFVEPPKDPEVLNDGRTFLISVGRKGQYVGVLGLYQTADQKMRYQRVELNSRYNGKTEAMRKLIDEDFVAELRQAGVVASYPRRTFVHPDSPPGATYVGAQTCKTCHPNTYAHWAASKHAHAYEALTMDPKRNREDDAHCVSCHTVGFEYKSGFLSVAETPLLKGVQCENCHGPGSKHAAEPLNAAFRRGMERDAYDFDKNLGCVKCHSEDDSPHFEFAKYWPQVMHNKMDNYDDPKTKVGIRPDNPDEVEPGYIGEKAPGAPSH
jgi:hypothetical protein